MYKKKDLDARYFKTSDDTETNIMWELHPAWWSRVYEYAWALKFAEKEDVALDYACGILHPFKFALSDICKKTVACERDIRIISKEAILEEIKNEMGEEIYNNFNQEYFDKLICCHTPSNQTPFDIDEFDKIFCISLFEHINKKERIEILQEFYRILKAKGMVVLTFDCPAIDILELKEMAISVGFKVLGNTDYKIPENVVKGEIYSPDLICGRMVLQKQYL